MTFHTKLKRRELTQIWQEYCGFLDMDMDQYMEMQHRLLAEQLHLWTTSGLGQRILRGKTITSLEAFRKEMPLTSYEDYADLLLDQSSDLLPEEPLLWIETTWEGLGNAVKRAPYTRGMLENFKHNMIAFVLLSRASKRGDIPIKPYEKVLHGCAPLPYLSGLIPYVIQDESAFEMVPPMKTAERLSFSEKNKLGFKMGLRTGLDYFFSMGSIAYYISKSLCDMASSGSGGGSHHLSPKILWKMMKAKNTAKQENRQILPKDLYDLQSMICSGTDNRCYKDELEAMWGIRPFEVFLGTEPTCIGTETWNRDGMYFFPDGCFYEFIPQAEMLKSFDDKTYVPKTYVMDEVVIGELYELVITNFKGGAFARYRVGDMYRCVALHSVADNTKIPRFEYVDRVPTVIDIGGFTRITENSISRAIALSRLSLQDWIATKEFNEDGHPFLHMYVEMSPQSIATHALSCKILEEHLGIYFKYIDHDYEDLKKILGMNPLEITIVRCGTFQYFQEKTGSAIRKMRPSAHDITTLLQLHEEDYPQRNREER